MKGILSLKGEDRKYVFQGVHMLFDGKPERPWKEMERLNEMVFIGRNLDAEELNGGLSHAWFENPAKSYNSFCFFDSKAPQIAVSNWLGRLKGIGLRLLPSQAIQVIDPQTGQVLAQLAEHGNGNLD